MKMKRIAALATLVLGGIVGCGEEAPAPTPSTPAPPPTQISKPGPMPSAQPAKGPGMSVEMTPAPSKEAPKPADVKKDEAPKVEGPKTEKSQGDTAAVKLTGDELAAIKELPAADQEPAIKQAVCPVSNEHLGEMGKPVKVTAEGRSFFLCCDQCEKEVKANPKAVIAKLDAKTGKK